MKKLTTILSFLAIAILMVSCKKEPSLQQYLVESQEKKGFASINVSASVLKLNMDKASDEDKKTYESIRKINLVGLPYNQTTPEEYEAEKNKLKAIFKNKKYKKLMQFKNDGNQAKVFYLGEADAIDEIIAFGYGEDAGVGVARILGENMNPSKIMKMMRSVQLDSTDTQFSQIQKMLGGNSKMSKEERIKKVKELTNKKAEADKEVH